MKRRLHFNNISSLIYQMVAVVVGLILPRLILKYYGSAVNGIVLSVTQLLAVIALLDLGVGAVVQAAFYKPLSEKDKKKISEIYNASGRYFRIVAIILIFYVIGLCFYYGLFKADSFSWMFSAGIILSIAIGYFAQYFFGMTNSILVCSDQKAYVCTFINLITLIISTVISVILIVNGYSIQLVKLISSLVFLARPIYLSIYVRRNYEIERMPEVTIDAIPDKWSGMAQHVATILTGSIDNILLTIFSIFEQVSVYNIYVMPLNAVRNLIEVTSTNYKSFFGGIIAGGDREKLKAEFEKYELLMHFVVTCIFCAIVRVLVPFVLLYTEGVHDADYNVPLFAVVITAAYAIYSLRFVYSNIVFAGGKFKETRRYSIIEVILNFVISIILIKPLGLVGVAIGTCVSSGYRMCALAYYLKGDLVYRKFGYFVKHVVVDVVCIALSALATFNIPFGFGNFAEWFISGVLVALICGVICVVVNVVCYPEFRRVVRSRRSRN